MVALCHGKTAHETKPQIKQATAPNKPAIKTLFITSSVRFGLNFDCSKQLQPSLRLNKTYRQLKVKQIFRLHRLQLALAFLSKFIIFERSTKRCPQ
jgi:hypothetical protein